MAFPYTIPILSTSCGSTEIHDAQLGNGLPFFKLLNIKDTVVIPMKPMFQLAPYPLRFNAPHKTLISKTASHKKADAILWIWWLQCEEDKYNTALTDFRLHVMIYREAMHLNTIGCITEKAKKYPKISENHDSAELLYTFSVPALMSVEMT